MLESVKIARRQSEIRQALAELSGKDSPNEDEIRNMDTLDKEYRGNETRYRAALIAEDDERRAASDVLEKRDGAEWSALVGQFELRQVALALDEGRQIDGATAEVVSELRSRGGYRGVPVPWEALEMRAGETTTASVPDPMKTAPIIERIFADSVASRMGVSMINVGTGEVEYPVTTSDVTASWAASEGAEIAAPTPYTTINRPLKPDHTLGVRMAITRKALKQSGQGLEQAVRRDMNGAMRVAIDAAVFKGDGAAGQPTGVLNLAVTPAIVSTAADAKAGYGIFREAARRLMDKNAAAGPSSVRVLVRPLTWSILDDDLISGTSETEWDRMQRRFGAGSIVVSENALPDAAAEDATGKGAHTCLLTAVTGGVPPIYCATWGAVDLIRDPYSDAASGGLRLTALATMDVTISRSEQIQILTGVQDRA